MTKKIIDVEGCVDHIDQEWVERLIDFGNNYMDNIWPQIFLEALGINGGAEFIIRCRDPKFFRIGYVLQNGDQCIGTFAYDELIDKLKKIKSYHLSVEVELA